MAKPKHHEKHCQCKLRRGNQILHSWIPAKYAQINRSLGLKDEEGNWEEGWVVEKIWDEQRSLDVLARADLWKHHREGTDAYRDGDNGWETVPGRRAPVS